jgi:septal ring factor EnvC (AmiA/AmiB activator)
MHHNLMAVQGIYDKRQRTEVEMAKRDQELKQLQGWRSTVQSLLERFQELVAQQAAAAQAAAANGVAADATATEQDAKADAGRTLSLCTRCTS